MSKLTVIERLLPIRIRFKDWSIGYYYQLNTSKHENIKIYQEWATLKCHICHEWSKGCGEKGCNFCGVCKKCNTELEKIYEKENKFI